MCRPPCCAPPARSIGPTATARAWPALALIVLAVLVGVPWPVLLVGVIALTLTVVGALWLIAALARRLNRALNGPGLDITHPRTVPGDPDPARWISATITDLPDRPHRSGPRALPSADPARPTGLPWSGHESRPVRSRPGPPVLGLHRRTHRPMITGPRTAEDHKPPPPR